MRCHRSNKVQRVCTPFYVCGKACLQDRQTKALHLQPVSRTAQTCQGPDLEQVHQVFRAANLRFAKDSPDLQVFRFENLRSKDSPDLQVFRFENLRFANVLLAAVEHLST